MEQGPRLSKEEMGLDQTKEVPQEFTVGQRVSFVEGESLMGTGNPVTKFGRVDQIRHDTVSVEVEDTGLEGTPMIVQVAKGELSDASQK